jgi:hypothetical protein
MRDGGEGAGAATGGVRTMLRLEGLAVLAAAIGGYAWLGGPWWLFVVLFLVPDIAFAGYAAGPRPGAIAYNAAHGAVGPIALFWLALLGGTPLWQQIALVWAAHVGFDRALGYGLKYAAGFGFTHLGRIGRQKSA